MADFVAVLKKTLDGMGETTPAIRERVYGKARATVAAKLAAINPPPPPSVAERQRRALEDAITSIEREYAANSDPLSELEDVFASLKNPQPKVLEQPSVKTGAWPKASPAPAAPRHAEPAARQAPPLRQPMPAAAPAAPVDLGDDDAPEAFVRQRPDAVRRRSYGPLLVAAVMLAVIAGGGYGIWLNRDAFGDLLGLGGGSSTAEAPPSESAPAADTPAAESPAPATSETPKFTQRLTPEGAETDPGPANGGATVGEGTSVAALTQPPGATPPIAAQPGETAAPGGEEAAPGTTNEAAATPPATASDPALAVGQKAIFYEERTSASEGSAEPGSIVWSLVQESPGGSLPPEPAIRAEATIPGKDVQLRMTIKRNADQSLPASHIIEMIFLTPEGFPGGGIDNILRVAMKGSEQEAGNPLIGIPAKIADGFFLVALNDSKAETDANLTLLRRQSWIDIPVVYKSGRRALFTMEKGIPGDQVFDEALKAWATPSAGSTTAPG
ncbi:hypothetical protein [Mesorhizobium sp. KR9-304]|uniref:hypothetical protein n=1 Tax=Mesorhizobium sp. KR9-304 TaxID=3156614 RepID=UPI0032B49A0B